MYILPSREELLKMPLSHLRNVRIETTDQEKIVQEIVNIRMAAQPLADKIYRGDIPFKIVTKEEEDKWQAIIDQRTKELQEKYAQAGKTEEQLVEEELAKLKGQKELLTKFCQFCDSKGVRHLKVCTKPK